MTVREAVNRAIRSSLDAFRLDVFERKPNHHYVPDYYGRSAHKQADIRELPRFGGLARDAVQQGNAYLYYDRLFTLDTALQNIARTRPGATVHIAEVGVFRGGTSEFLARSAMSLDLSCRLHCIDTFEGHDAQDLGAFDTDHKPGHFAETSYDKVKALLAPYPFATVYKGRIQDVSAQLDQAFSFVHLDVDIYEPTRFALDFFSRKMPPGGVIVVDDHGFNSCPGAKQAVDEFAANHTDYFVLPVLTGQAVLVRTSRG